MRTGSRGLLCAMGVGLAAAAARAVGWDHVPVPLVVADFVLLAGLGLLLGELLARWIRPGRATALASVALLAWYGLENVLRGHPDPALLALLVGLVPLLGVGVRGAASAGLVGLALWAPSPRAAPPAGAHTPQTSVLFIVIDTLRQDHMSLYGYERPTTPEIDRLAATGRVYTQTMAAAPYTMSSHASMFTGEFPRHHGAHLIRTETGSEVRGLHNSAETIAEVAHAAGIRTAAITSNFAAGTNGLEQGFDTWSIPNPSTWPRFALTDTLVHLLTPGTPWYGRYPELADAAEIRKEAQKWLEANGDARFFLFLNFMDVHQPTWRRDDPVIPHDPAEDDFDHLQVEEAMVGLADPARGPGLRLALNNRYDRHLRYADAEIGALLDWVRQQEQLRDTTIILTSDHGEFLGEFGLAFHPIGLHPQVLDVPLVLWGPKIQPGRDDRPTSGIDIMAAIADALDLRKPPSAMATSLGESGAVRAAELYTQFQPALLQPPYASTMDRAGTAIRTGSLHYIHWADGSQEAWDLDGDPFHELCGEDPARCAEGARAYEAWDTSTPYVRGGSIFGN